MVTMIPKTDSKPVQVLIFNPQQLYPKQRECFLGGGPNVRFRYIEASSGSGKTWCAGLIAGVLACNSTQDEKICWMAPIYTQSKIGFETALSLIPDDYRQFMERKNSISASAGSMKISFAAISRELGFPGMGGTIEYRSADKPDSIYGGRYIAGLVDEASRCIGQAIMALMSTLGKGGMAYPIWQWGNIKGRSNHFYRNCRRVERELNTVPWDAQRSWYSSMTYHDAIKAWQRNPDGTYVIDFSGKRIPVQSIEHIEDMRVEYTLQEFEELYENRPMSSSSRPFSDDDIDSCAVTCRCPPSPLIKPWDDQWMLCPICEGLSSKPAVAAGWDVARQVDYNVVILLDEDGATCGFFHWKQNNWLKILHTAMEYIPFGVPFMVDVTGKGDVIPDLIAEHYPERLPCAYKSASDVRSAPRLEKHLISTVQSRNISFPIGLITEELASVETIATQTGVKYEAPKGYFDDCVDGLQLAAWMFAHGRMAETSLHIASKDMERTRTGWNTEENGLILNGTGPGTAQRERRTRTGWA